MYFTGIYISQNLAKNHHLVLYYKHFPDKF
jgi:hypothetical protein